jgi:hypothetical protein
MKVKVLLIRPDDRGELVELERSLAAFQGAVGGYLEQIPLAHGAFLYCDEEGLMKGLPQNVPATSLARRLGAAVTLAGPVVFFGASGSEEKDVPDEVVSVWQEAAK